MNHATAETLIARAEAALAGGAFVEGLTVAQQSWAEVGALDDALLRRRAGLVLAHLAYRTGSLALMVDVALQILPLLRAGGPTAELIDVLRMAAVGGCDTSRFDVALASAQEAHQLAVEIGDRARMALAVNALGCFFERSGDPWQAERLLLESLALARQQPELHPVFAALNNLAAVLIGKFHMMRDALPLEEARQPLRDALSHAAEAVALSQTAGEVFHRVFTLGNLGEVQVNLGLLEAAEASLTEAMALARQHAFEAQIWRIAATLGELELLRGQPEQAWHTLSTALHDSSDARPLATHLRLHHAMWRCAREQGRSDAALVHLQHYVQLERQRSMTQLRAQSDLYVTRMEAEHMRLEAKRLGARASALEADARRDQLTGLGNRREAELRWPELLRQVRQSGLPISVAMLDLDHFKQVNDQFGHAVGDRVLVELATLLRANTRAGDMVVRLGGEEFLLVLPEAGPERAAEVCERLRAQVAAHDWGALASGLTVTLSVGLTSTPPYDAEALSLRADAALYRAKAAGRNCVVQI